MKLKKTMLFLFAVVVAASSLAMTAAAQETEDPITSKGTITFGDKGVTKPVDPENPENPQEPPEVDGTNQGGNLTLDVVPYPYFGEYPLPTVNAVYSSRLKSGKSGGNTGDPAKANAQTFIQVSDARTESTGWNVAVSAGAFENEEEPSNWIKGAQLTFRQGTVRGPGNAGESDKPTAKEVILMCTDEEHYEDKIFKAEAEKGIGTWVNRLYPSPLAGLVGDENEFIQLFIPANSGAVLGVTYVSDLTWTLQNVP